MIPYIYVFNLKVSVFYLCGIVGLSVFFAIMYYVTGKLNSEYNERKYIFTKLIYAVIGGFSGALIYDALFRVSIDGFFKLEGISFYGGLIGSALTLYLCVKYSPYGTVFSPLQWLDKVIVPFAVFHMIGRVGCFFGGCCYGKVTDSCIGVHFPDRPDFDILHNGQARVPTQLIEATAILAIVLLLVFVFKNNSFINYLILYPIARFIIEIFRDDERGSTGTPLSPSQLVSILLIIIPIVYYIKKSSEKQ